jgi:hypothetical protein
LHKAGAGKINRKNKINNKNKTHTHHAGTLGVWRHASKEHGEGLFKKTSTSEKTNVDWEG